MMGSIVVKASMLSLQLMTKLITRPPKKNKMLCKVDPRRLLMGCSMALQSQLIREIRSPDWLAS